MEKQPARRMSYRHIICDQVIIKLLIPHELVFYSERNLDRKMKKYVCIYLQTKNVRHTYTNKQIKTSSYSSYA